jgi:hypothetical protein
MGRLREMKRWRRKEAKGGVGTYICRSNDKFGCGRKGGGKDRR